MDIASLRLIVSKYLHYTVKCPLLQGKSTQRFYFDADGTVVYNGKKQGAYARYIKEMGFS